MKIFWAWQSDQDQSVCRNFIKASLLEATKQLAADLELDERPEVDHDTKGQVGMPDIVDTILEKIVSSTAFVADLTTVARTKRKKAVANPNVLIELGFAKRAIGTDKIICVANSYWFKGPSDLPFDLRNRRGPITYHLPPDTAAETRQAVKMQLVGALKGALKPILQNSHSNRSELDETWLASERSTAEAGIQSMGLSAQLELILHPHFSISRSQAELLDAVRRSQITTFGWPIGVLIETAEHRPRPFADGVRMEIRSKDRNDGFGTSYDYWSLRRNGDLYLLKSLFEDKRAKDAIFFNTRIVRIAEALLFAEQLYLNLGARDGMRFSVRAAHRNFKGRTLSAAGSRSIFPATTTENESSTQIEQTVGQVSSKLPESVKALLQPFFVLFEFKEFSDSVYEDIVRRFERGETS